MIFKLELIFADYRFDNAVSRGYGSVLGDLRRFARQAREIAQLTAWLRESPSVARTAAEVAPASQGSGCPRARMRIPRCDCVTFLPNWDLLRVGFYLSGFSTARPAMTDKLSYTLKEAAAASGLGRTKLYELINSGELPLVKIGARTLIRRGSGGSARPQPGASCRLEDRMARQ